MAGIKVGQAAQKPLHMDGKDLGRLERIARNLPCEKLTLADVDSDLGRIYLAFGKDILGGWHGVWGTRGVARTMQFKPESTDLSVRNALVCDAMWMLEQMDARSMFDQGWWQSGQVAGAKA